MLHKAGCIAAAAALYPQVILQRCQWAYPAAKFNQRGPENRRYMDPGKNAPAQDKQAAQHDKKYEKQVYYNNQIGKKMIDHVS